MDTSVNRKSRPRVLWKAKGASRCVSLSLLLRLTAWMELWSMECCMFLAHLAVVTIVCTWIPSSEYCDTRLGIYHSLISGNGCISAYERCVNGVVGVLHRSWREKKQRYSRSVVRPVGLMHEHETATFNMLTLWCGRPLCRSYKWLSSYTNARLLSRSPGDFRVE